MNDDTYITEINTLEDAGKLFKLIKKDLDIELEFVDGHFGLGALCPKLYYGAGYATFKKNTLRSKTKTYKRNSRCCCCMENETTYRRGKNSFH